VVWRSLTAETGRVVNPLLLDLSQLCDLAGLAICSRKSTAKVQRIAGTTGLFLTGAEFTIGIPLPPRQLRRTEDVSFFPRRILTLVPS
jgi:hypothetical protein